MNPAIKIIFRIMFGSLLFSGLCSCVVFPLEKTDSVRSLYWCPPLHNCASTEATTFIHSIPPFELIMPLDEAWPIIQHTISSLQGTQIEHQYSGYIYAKSYSNLFKFVDYVEILAVPDENRLNVRSSSLLGLTDMFVNYLRTEHLRTILEDKGVISHNK